MTSALSALLALAPVAPVPAPPAPRAIVAVVDPAAPKVEPSRNVSGWGSVSATAFLMCPMDRDGFRSGSAFINQTMTVENADGVRGTVTLSGSALVQGYCFHGSGNVSGFATLYGSGPVYDRDGKYLGSARVSGTVNLSGYGSSSVWLNGTINVSGSY